MDEAIHYLSLMANQNHPVSSNNLDFIFDAYKNAACDI